MMGAGNKGYREPRSPREMAQRWEKKQIAYMNDLVAAGIGCRITTELASVTVIPVTGRGRKRMPDIGRYHLLWRAEEIHSSNPDLSIIASKVIYIAGMPAETPYSRSDRDGRLRTYPDKLFQGGGLELIVPQDEAANRPDRTHGLGSVLGLAIIAGNEAYTAWRPPEDPAEMPASQ